MRINNLDLLSKKQDGKVTWGFVARIFENVARKKRSCN